jgi:hypothetical protein
MAGLPRLGRRYKGVSPVAELQSWEDDGEGAVRARREGVGGVGGFTEGGVGFYRVEARPSVFNGRRWRSFNGPGWRRRLPVIEEGEMASINGEIKGIDAAVFFSSGGGVRVDPGGGARPVGGAVCARLRCGRKKKVAGWAVRVGWAGREAEAQWGRGGRKMAGWKKRMGCGWAERPDGLKVTGKILFRIKFDFWIYQGFGNLHKDI